MWDVASDFLTRGGGGRELLGELLGAGDGFIPIGTVLVVFFVVLDGLHGARHWRNVEPARPYDDSTPEERADRIPSRPGWDGYAACHDCTNFRDHLENCT